MNYSKICAAVLVQGQKVGLGGKFPRVVHLFGDLVVQYLNLRDHLGGPS